VPADIENRNNEEILDSLRGTIDFDTNRVVGYYVDANFELGVGVYVAGEGVRFIGIDTTTGERVVANYLGITLEAGAPSPGAIGGGVFGFTGPPASLGGWSLGAQLSAGVSSGISIATGDGSLLYFAGAEPDISANVSAGYTYSVYVNGRTEYFFGSVDQGQSFTNSAGLFEAVIESSSPSFSVRPSPITFYNNDPLTTGIQSEENLTLVQTLTLSQGRDREILWVRSHVIDENGEVVNTERARDILEASSTHGVRPNTEGDLTGSAYYATRPSNGSPLNPAYNTVETYFELLDHCFLAGTQIDMSDGSKKPIENIAVGDEVLSFDAETDGGRGALM